MEAMEKAKLESVNDYIKLGLVHEIHTSERKSFRGCRRRWDWVYRHNFYPRTTHKNLEFGIAYHTGMETYYNPETWNFPQEVKVQRALQEFVNDCERQRKEAIAVEGSLLPEIKQDYDERIELGKGMINHYFAKVAPLLDVNWKPIKVEIEFMIPIPNPETNEPVIWCKCNKCWETWVKATYTQPYAVDDDSPSEEDEWEAWKGLPVVYSGRLDMLAEDEFGNYWIFDWKTAGSIKEDKSFLDLDDQIGSYVWALRRLGLPVKGFVYHEQLKSFPEPPKQNKTRRLGCIYSVAKNQSTDFRTYLETVSRYDTEAWSDGKYDSMLQYLKMEGMKYYDRRQIDKTNNEIDSIEYNIGLEALDMTDPNIRLYPNGGRFSCDNCAFKLPCIEKNNKGDYKYALETMFIQKDHYYKELRLSTDGKS